MSQWYFNCFGYVFFLLLAALSGKMLLTWLGYPNLKFNIDQPSAKTGVKDYSPIVVN